MPRARAKPLYEIGDQWIATDPGSPHLYRFWTNRGTGRTRRQSLGTPDLEQAKARLAKYVLAHPDERPKTIPVPGHVYFIQGRETKLIKIGWTEWSVNGRLNSLKAVTKEPLRLLTFTTGDKKLERAFHKVFAAHRVRGEWFHPAPEILETIEVLDS